MEKNQQPKPMKVFVTFHYVTPMKTEKIAVSCPNLWECFPIANDVASLSGAKYVKINKRGRLGKDYKVISLAEYHKEYGNQ